MFSLSPIKILVVVAVVMVLLGPDKLPEVAHKLGSSWRALKRIQERVETEVRDVIPDLPSSGDLARMARSPVNLLNELADRADQQTTGPLQDVNPGANDPPRDEGDDDTDDEDDSEMDDDLDEESTPSTLHSSRYRMLDTTVEPPPAADPSLN